MLLRHTHWPPKFSSQISFSNRFQLVWHYEKFVYNGKKISLLHGSPFYTCIQKWKKFQTWSSDVLSVNHINVCGAYKKVSVPFYMFPSVSRFNFLLAPHQCWDANCSLQNRWILQRDSFAGVWLWVLGNNGNCCIFPATYTFYCELLGFKRTCRLVHCHVALQKQF